MVNYSCKTCIAEFDFISHFQEHIVSPMACEKFLNKSYDCEYRDKKYTTEKAKKYNIVKRIHYFINYKK